jgi:hypothetical protein
MDPPQLLELRAGGKMHGRLHTGQMILEVKHGDRIFRYDLPATAQERRSVVDRVPITGATERYATKMPRKSTA